jgi:hypothetical protein
VVRMNGEERKAEAVERTEDRRVAVNTRFPLSSLAYDGKRNRLFVLDCHEEEGKGLLPNVTVLDFSSGRELSKGTACRNF